MFEEPIPLFVQKYLGKPDDRVENWVLLNSSKWFLTTWIIYISIVVLASKLMRNRQPFQLKKHLLVYNSFQVYFSFFIFREILISAVNMKYSLVCQPLVRGSDPNSLRMAEAFWFFYLSKYIDLFDTLFLVLKKKQISFLHVYHHSSMLFNWYIGILYLPGGQTFISVLANSFVHVIMYSYYLLAAMGPNVQKYLWWKKYLTQLQLIQFFVIIFHIIMGLVAGCDLPVWLAWFTIIYLLTLITLFLNFYVKSYKMPKGKSYNGKEKLALASNGDKKVQ